MGYGNGQDAGRMLPTQCSPSKRRATGSSSLPNTIGPVSQPDEQVRTEPSWTPVVIPMSRSWLDPGEKLTGLCLSMQRSEHFCCLPQASASGWAALAGFALSMLTGSKTSSSQGRVLMKFRWDWMEG